MKHLCTIAFWMLLCKGVSAQAPSFPEQWPLQIDSFAYQPLVGEWVVASGFESVDSSHIVFTFEKDFSFNSNAQLLLTWTAWNDWTKAFDKTDFRLKRFNSGRP